MSSQHSVNTHILVVSRVRMYQGPENKYLYKFDTFQREREREIKHESEHNFLVFREKVILTYAVTHIHKERE